MRERERESDIFVYITKKKKKNSDIIEEERARAILTARALHIFICTKFCKEEEEEEENPLYRFKFLVSASNSSGGYFLSLSVFFDNVYLIPFFLLLFHFLFFLGLRDLSLVLTFFEFQILSLTFKFLGVWKLF